MQEHLKMSKQQIQSIKQQRLTILDLLYKTRLQDSEHQPKSLLLSEYNELLGDYRFNVTLLLEEKLIEPVSNVKHRLTSKGVLAYERMLEELTD